MARPKLSIPHERMKASLKAQKLNLRVKIAESKEKLSTVNDQLKAMSPPRKSE